MGGNLLGLGAEDRAALSRASDGDEGEGASEAAVGFGVFKGPNLKLCQHQLKC